MVRGEFILLIVALTAPSLAAAQTVSFADGAAMLSKSCAPDIVANCRGVNIDTTRLKDCLYRNQDVMSEQCKADYPRAFDTIQKRIAARATVGRECEYEIVKKCRGKAKEVSKSLICLLATPNVSARCSRAIGDVGYNAADDLATRLSGLETPLDLKSCHAPAGSPREIEIESQERASAAEAAADCSRTYQAAELQRRYPVRYRHTDRPAGILSDAWTSGRYAG